MHLSRPGARESFRYVSVVTPVVTATIAGPGFGPDRHALLALAEPTR